MDSDHQWVHTLVQGSRMFCRIALQETDYGKAVELAKEAGTILQKAKVRVDTDDKELVASVQLAEGIWQSVMAYTGKSSVSFLSLSSLLMASRTGSQNTNDSAI